MLIEPGKSSRLLAMRAQASDQKPAPQSSATISNHSQSGADNLSPELLLARQLIDQRLAEILAQLPVGKQQRLFKIRYGVALDEIQHLAIKKVFGLLAIQNPTSAGRLTKHKAIEDLTYNGQPASIE